MYGGGSGNLIGSGNELGLHISPSLSPADITAGIQAGGAGGAITLRCHNDQWWM